MAEMKSCTKCGECKDVSLFGWNITNKKERVQRRQCLDCYNEARRSYYERTKEKWNEKRREYQRRPEVAARRKELRMRPGFIEKEREKSRNYKKRPDVYAAIKIQRASYQSSPEKRALMVLDAARQRCKKHGFAFSVDIDWVRKRVVEHGRCEITGIPFDFDVKPRERRRNAFFPSLDQKVAGEGYTPENTRVVLVAVNLALCDWGLDQFLHIATEALKNNGYKVEKDGTQSLLPADREGSL